MKDKKLIFQSIALNLLIVVAIAEPSSAAAFNADSSQGSIPLSKTLEYTPPTEDAPGDRCASRGTPPCNGGV
ncbi:MAG: hypothetical protein F6J93_20660 [Oscillatoria sp. SIO1A7]|nr:hypothetical protein [Oscillatoria sp. SIO1A7]